MKDIKSYEGLYAVTKDGKVWSYPKSNRNKKGMWLKQHRIEKKRINGTKYIIVSVGLWKNKKRKLFLVHRLVAMAYIPNPKNKPDVNHKNGNSLINEEWNLEWNTKIENMQHAERTGLSNQFTEKQRKARSQNGKKTGAINGMKSRRLFSMGEVDCIRKIYEISKKSFRSIAKTYGCADKTIGNICNYKSYIQETQYKIALKGV